MKKSHTNFQVKKCGLFINQEYPFLHATPDFLTCCDCCGLRCGEVKCPLCIQDANFEYYAALRNSCLVTTDGGGFTLNRSHNYYFQVQQQLFTLQERNHNDFIVYAIDNKGNAHLEMERILLDVQHWDRVLPKLKAVWRICVLPEVLGRWYTRRYMVEVKGPDDDSICFCRTVPDGETISCSNEDCPYGKFHPSCLSLTNVTIPKKWYCPHCSRLQQFKRYSRKQTAGKAKGNQNNTGALATLTQDHFDLICNPHGWLDCDIIQQAHILLHNENLNIEGFQRPTFGPVRNFDIVSGEFVQILHTGNSHWENVCALAKRSIFEHGPSKLMVLRQCCTLEVHSQGDQVACEENISTDQALTVSVCKYASKETSSKKTVQSNMEWTEEHDNCLCQEILVLEPSKYKKGSISRGQIWEKIANNLNGP
ncbi:Inhibitor of growth protein 2 [Stylophora pistillata]|uniref:Inhibitor of growth protein 2 n=1 Tax=Stylophora pistillata TaxID=50429 RepID=A0A2B4SZ33_STYPI|nr:Inhibitor of growth protein 2 [Stylophora pistillata]